MVAFLVTVIVLFAAASMLMERNRKSDLKVIKENLEILNNIKKESK